MKQVFSKIWIGAIILLLIFGGILAWQFWPKKVIPPPVEKVTPTQVRAESPEEKIEEIKEEGWVIRRDYESIPEGELNEKVDKKIYRELKSVLEKTFGKVKLVEALPQTTEYLQPFSYLIFITDRVIVSEDLKKLQKELEVMGYGCYDKCNLGDLLRMYKGTQYVHTIIIHASVGDIGRAIIRVLEF